MPTDKRTQQIAAKLGVKTTRHVAQHPVLTLWEAERDDETPVTLVVLDGAVRDEEKHRFAAGARALAALGSGALAQRILPVSKLGEDADAFLSDVRLAGSLLDVVGLKWGLDRKLECIRRIAGAVTALHAAKIVHASLCPVTVLLDGDFHAIVSEAGLVSISASLAGDRENVFGYGAYAAPEVRDGTAADARSDIFSLGKLLAFLLLETEPAEELEKIPRLEALATTAPAGLVRIIRKCTSLAPDARYGAVADFLAELDKYTSHDSVGVAHPSVADKNTGATMQAPPAPPASQPHAHAHGHGHAQSSAESAAKPEAKRPPIGKHAPVAAPPSIGAAPFVVVGVLGLGGACAAAFLHLLPEGPLSIAASAGAAILGLGMPRAAARPVLSRVMWAGLLYTAALVGEPTARLAAFGTSVHSRSPDPETRAKAVRAMLRSGRRDLSGMSLGGVDLTGADLSEADLRHSDLTHADLTGACLIGANLEGAKLAGAKVHAANMAGTHVVGASDLEAIECDGRTYAPEGWICRNQHFAVAPPVVEPPPEPQPEAPPAAP